MTDERAVTSDEVAKLYGRLKKEAESSGYHLNPDVEFTKELVKGLLTNEKRYGYWACPCRYGDAAFVAICALETSLQKYAPFAGLRKKGLNASCEGLMLIPASVLSG